MFFGGGYHTRIKKSRIFSSLFAIGGRVRPSVENSTLFFEGLPNTVLMSKLRIYKCVHHPPLFSLVCVWMSRLAATQHSVNVVCSCHVTCDVSRVTRTDTQSYTTTITTDGSVKNCRAVKCGLLNSSYSKYDLEQRCLQCWKIPVS